MHTGKWMKFQQADEISWNATVLDLIYIENEHLIISTAVCDTPKLW